MFYSDATCVNCSNVYTIHEYYAHIHTHTCDGVYTSARKWCDVVRDTTLETIQHTTEGGIMVVCLCYGASYTTHKFARCIWLNLPISQLIPCWRSVQRVLYIAWLDKWSNNEFHCVCLCLGTAHYMCWFCLIKG